MMQRENSCFSISVLAGLGQRFPFNCFKSGKITTYKKFIMPRGLKSNRTLSPY